MGEGLNSDGDRLDRTEVDHVANIQTSKHFSLQLSADIKLVDLAQWASQGEFVVAPGEAHNFACPSGHGHPSTCRHRCSLARLSPSKDVFTLFQQFDGGIPVVVTPN